MFDRWLQKLQGRGESDQPAKTGGPPQPPAAAPPTKLIQPGEEDPPPFTPPRLPPWEPGDTVFDHYLLEAVSRDNQGGLAFRCRHPSHPFPLRLEIPPGELLQTPAGIASILQRAQLRIKTGLHPNIAASFNLRFTDRLPVMIGEDVAGESLAAWLNSGRCGNPRSDLSLAVQCCHGLEQCHGLGLIHGDLRPELIRFTPNSLVKISGFGLRSGSGLPPGIQPEASGHIPAPANSVTGHGVPQVAASGTAIRASTPEPARSPQDVVPRDRLPDGFRPATGPAREFSPADDIYALGLCLWQMFSRTRPYREEDNSGHPGKLRPRKDGVIFPPALQVALLRSVSADPAKRYRKIGELRQDLLKAYQDFYKVPCPYSVAPLSDQRAEILNNQAVFLLEEGKNREAARKLARSLELNDTLPEAVYNDLLLRWRLGRSTPSRILRRIEAHRRPGQEQPALLELEKAAKLNLTGLKSDFDRDAETLPDFRLVSPSLELKVFRRGPDLEQLQAKIWDHLEHRRYQACHDALLDTWQREGFRKDRFYNRIYEDLLLVREKLTPIQGQRFMALEGHKGPVKSLAWVPKSRRIASAGRDGRIIIHDLGQGGRPEVQETIELPSTVMIAAPDGKHLAVGTREGGVHLISAKTGKSSGQEQSHRCPVSALAFSADGKVLASGGEDGSIIIRRLSTGREDGVSLPDSGAIRALLYPDQELDLISGSEDGTIRQWKSRLRECTATIPAHGGAIYDLAATPDGRMLISTGADRRIKTWDRQSGENRHKLKGHGERIRALLALPDGKTMISAGDDDLLLAWDLASGEKLFSLDGRGDGICSLTRGPRSHTLLAGRADGTINVWLLIYRLNFDIL